jgi:hypothetical protein
MSPDSARNFSRTLELGKEIASNLSDHDVLGRWMAHHIGDLIARAETTPEKEAEGVRRETVTAVLALWGHRAKLPVPSPPLDAFEPVFRALERLSEPQDPWAFYRMFSPGHQPGGGDMAAAPLLGIALALEDTVRRVVREIITVATLEAADKEAKWLGLAEHVEEDDQRAALDALLEFAQSLGTYSGDADNRQVATAGPSKLMTALRQAEKQLAEAREALEERVPGTSSEDEDSGPA